MKWKRNYEYAKKCNVCEGKFDNINDVSEWLGFQYNKYLKYILAACGAYDFEQLKAITEAEIEAGYLSSEQVTSLRGVLETGFKEGQSIDIISKNIDKNVGIKDLYRMNEEGNVMIGAAGMPILQVSKDKRSVNIARTEITRLANKGAVKYYKKNGVSKIKHIAANSDRTCVECMELDNTIYEIGGEPGLPVHPNCRCTYAPFVELK